jgi:hypothetical protein
MMLHPYKEILEDGTICVHFYGLCKAGEGVRIRQAQRDQRSLEPFHNRARRCVALIVMAAGHY